LNGENSPGPGGHDPIYKNLQKCAPRFGFGSEKRAEMGTINKFPGPGNYTLNPIVGNEGNKSTMHATISYSPEARENSFKPGPGMYNGDSLKIKKT